MLKIYFVTKPTVLICYNSLRLKIFLLDRTTLQYFVCFYKKGKESISSTFYVCLFHTKVLCTALLQLHFGSKLFGAKFLNKKCARKTLMKLSEGGDQTVFKASITNLIFLKSNSYLCRYQMLMLMILCNCVVVVVLFFHL